MVEREASARHVVGGLHRSFIVRRHGGIHPRAGELALARGRRAERSRQVDAREAPPCRPTRDRKLDNFLGAAAPGSDTSLPRDRHKRRDGHDNDARPHRAEHAGAAAACRGPHRSGLADGRARGSTPPRRPLPRGGALRSSPAGPHRVEDALQEQAILHDRLRRRSGIERITTARLHARLPPRCPAKDGRRLLTGQRAEEGAELAAAGTKIAKPTALVGQQSTPDLLRQVARIDVRVRPRHRTPRDRQDLRLVAHAQASQRFWSPLQRLVDLEIRLGATTAALLSPCSCGRVHPSLARRPIERVGTVVRGPRGLIPPECTRIRRIEQARSPAAIAHGQLPRCITRRGR